MRASRAGAHRNAARWLLVGLLFVLASCEAGNEVAETDRAQRGAASSSDEDASERSPSRPDVFVVVMDTVRLDVQRLWNEALPIGDALAALARDGVVFDRLRAPSSWTKTSVATLLTGLDPARHRVLGRRDRLAEDSVTLAAVLRRDGYATLGWSTNPHILPSWGFDRGFDQLLDVHLPTKGNLTAWGWDVVGQVLESIDASGPAGGTFYYIHLIDPHFPYTPAAREQAEVRALGDRVAEQYPGPAEGKASARLRSEGYPNYLAEVIELDRALGRLFDGLRERGRYDDALILAVSDHGEEFMDHGGHQHMATLYDEVLRVPAVLKLPGNARAGTRLRDDTEMRDLFPTLLHSLGIAVPEGLPGRDVFTAPDIEAPSFYTLVVGRRRVSAVRVGRWKLIVDHRSNRHRLFDLEADPGERENLVRQHPERVRALLTVLENDHAAHSPGWHVRACGCGAPGALSLELSGNAAPEALGLEPGDRVTFDASGIQVALSLPPARTLPDGAPLPLIVPDEDEIVIPLGAAAPVLHGRLVGEGAEGARLGVAVGNGPIEALEGAIDLGALGERAVVSPSEPIRCAPSARVNDDAPTPCPPHIRVWHSLAPDRVALEDIDPEMVERLRALGYTIE